MAKPDAKIWQTAMEAWPEDLFRFCLPHLPLALSKADLDAMLGLTKGTASALPKGLATELDAALAGMPDGAHIRLGLCSFKHGSVVPRFRSSGDLAAVLRRAAPRVRSVLTGYLAGDTDAALFVFPFAEIPKWSEFRVFVRDRQLVGVSQYHHRSAFTGLTARIDRIAEAVGLYCDHLLPALHIDDAVADVFMVPRADGGFDPVLMELNPFIRRTDPCLFTWSGGGDFDGGLRYHAA